MKETKSISRSIRMTETVHDYVNRQIGTGFNQKFQNLCFRFMWEEAELDRRIKEKQELLRELTDKIRDVQSAIKSAEDIHWMLERTKTDIRKLNDKCNSIAPAAAGTRAKK